MNNDISLPYGGGAEFGEYSVTNKSLNSTPNYGTENGEYQTTTNEFDFGTDYNQSGDIIETTNTGDILGDFQSSTNSYEGFDNQYGSSIDDFQSTNLTGGDSAQFEEYQTTTNFDGLESTYTTSYDANLNDFQTTGDNYELNTYEEKTGSNKQYDYSNTEFDNILSGENVLETNGFTETTSSPLADTNTKTNTNYDHQINHTFHTSIELNNEFPTTTNFDEGTYQTKETSNDKDYSKYNINDFTTGNKITDTDFNIDTYLTSEPQTNLNAYQTSENYDGVTLALQTYNIDENKKAVEQNVNTASTVDMTSFTSNDALGFETYESTPKYDLNSYEPIETNNYSTSKSDLKTYETKFESKSNISQSYNSPIIDSIPSFDVTPYGKTETETSQGFNYQAPKAVIKEVKTSENQKIETNKVVEPTFDSSAVTTTSYTTYTPATTTETQKTDINKISSIETTPQTKIETTVYSEATPIFDTTNYLQTIKKSSDQKSITTITTSLVEKSISKQISNPIVSTTYTTYEIPSSVSKTSDLTKSKPSYDSGFTFSKSQTTNITPISTTIIETSPLPLKTTKIPNEITSYIDTGFTTETKQTSSPTSYFDKNVAFKDYKSSSKEIKPTYESIYYTTPSVSIPQTIKAPKETISSFETVKYAPPTAVTISEPVVSTTLYTGSTFGEPKPKKTKYYTNVQTYINPIPSSQKVPISYSTSSYPSTIVPSTSKNKTIISSGIPNTSNSYVYNSDLVPLSGPTTITYLSSPYETSISQVNYSDPILYQSTPQQVIIPQHRHHRHHRHHHLKVSPEAYQNSAILPSSMALPESYIYKLAKKQKLKKLLKKQLLKHHPYPKYKTRIYSRQLGK